MEVLTISVNYLKLKEEKTKDTKYKEIQLE